MLSCFSSRNAFCKTHKALKTWSFNRSRRPSTEESIASSLCSSDALYIFFFWSCSSFRFSAIYSLARKADWDLTLVSSMLSSSFTACIRSPISSLLNTTPRSSKNSHFVRLQLWIGGHYCNIVMRTPITAAAKTMTKAFCNGWGGYLFLLFR